jgi:hypothetical protein
MPHKMTGLPIYGETVEMSALPVEGEDGVWNVLAYAVDMKDTGVTLTGKHFQECVDNFKRYPKVPLVIEHADTDWFGHREWVEPRGWITDLCVGEYKRPDGRVVASLEGKIFADPETRLAINGDEKKGIPPKWPFGSVTVFPGRDEESAQEIGMCLWSFSLTAHPRLIDVPKLVASQALTEQRGLIEVSSPGELAKLLGGAESDYEGLFVRRPLVRVALGARRVLDADGAPIVRFRPDGTIEINERDDAQVFIRGAAAQQPEVSPMKFLEMAARFGIAAANEDDAREKILALAAEAPEVRKSLGLSATAPASEVVAKLASLATLAAKVPALEKEVAEFRTEREERATADRAAHIDALIAADPDLEKSRSALEVYARTNYGEFSKEYPKPDPKVLAERAVDEAAERRERSKDPQRLARLPGSGRQAKAPADVGSGPSAQDLVTAANILVEQYAERGLRLSYSEAIGMVTSGSESIFDSEPADAAQ